MACRAVARPLLFEPAHLFHVRRVEIHHIFNAVSWNIVKQIRGKITVWVNDTDAVPGLDVLQNLIAEQGRFSRSAFADGVKMLAAIVIVTMCVAYMTADPDRVKAIFSDPDKFVTADEFLFMLTAVIVLIFGPGKFSLDWLIWKKIGAPKKWRHLRNNAKQNRLSIFVNSAKHDRQAHGDEIKAAFLRCRIYQTTDTQHGLLGGI
jgi:hypothetical protein